MPDRKANKISIVKYLPSHPDLVHAPYIPEMDFYAAIKSGNIRKVKELCREVFHDKKGLGVLSDDSLRNIKYHFVISAALIARQCIEGGLSMSEAYSMSDYYIREADRLDDKRKISDLHDEMALAYASRMRQRSREKIFSRPVTECIDYILEHLDTRIRMEDLCSHVGLSKAHISRIFRNETGLTVTEYILSRKLETAKNMLDYSDHPMTWIAGTLAFPSQSYFTRAFKERYGMPPGRYRREGGRGSAQ